jgi:hypothetical protein
MNENFPWKKSLLEISYPEKSLKYDTPENIPFKKTAPHFTIRFHFSIYFHFHTFPVY